MVNESQELKQDFVKKNIKGMLGGGGVEQGMQGNIIKQANVFGNPESS